MKNKYLLPPLITFLFFIDFVSNAQPVTADFSANPSTGCTPVKVNFTNLSTGSGTLTYLWDLGGQGISTLKDPQATFIDPGVYDIKLVVDNGTQKDSIIRSVVVYKNPIANFTADPKGCIPDTIQFTDLSEPGDGVITDWNWDFRTGTIDTRRHPSNIYATPGNFDVFLEITDANGCKGNIEKQQYIQVANPPSASFSVSPVSSCTVPVTVALTNTSTGQGSLTYNWSFGDNSTSTQRNPSKTYNQFGVYSISLTVNSDYGCYDTVSATFFASEVVAAGTLSQGGKPVVNNGTICAGQMNFSSSSSGTNVVLWKFGDGITSISKSGFHQYTRGGNYTVLLIASPGSSCADTVIWNLVVEEPKADFAMSSDYSCKSPALVNFTENAANAVAWEWTFHDGTKVTTRNSSKSYSLPPESDPYKINTGVVFNTTLKVTSANGCTNAVTKSFTIKKPTTIFAIDVAQGCVPLNIKFSDHSLSDEDITNREWIFGDGQKLSGAADSAMHTYVMDNVFLSRLVITNDQGCTDTSFIIPVRSGKKLSPDFSFSKNSVCPGEILQFSDNSSEPDLIQGWHYTVEGVSINNLPGEDNPLWKVDADTGYLDLGLEVNYNGCISSVLKDNALFNKGAVSDFSFTFDCSSPFTYHFTGLSKGAENVKWTFGDASPADFTDDPVHTYAAEGNYQVELIAIKETCADTLRKEIKVRNPQAVIAADTLACAGEPVLLNGKASYSQVDYCFEKYYWDFGDTVQSLVTRNDSIAHTFSSRGTYSVKLFTFYDNYCIDSAMISIRVFGPHASFDPDTSYGCSPFEVNFADNSTTDIHPIESWHWNFADESDTTYTEKADTVSHVFSDPGIFEVRLTVTDTLGCAGTFTHTISSANPIAGFTVDKSLQCVGSDMKFYSFDLTVDSVLWDFGDGIVSHSDTTLITHAFSSKGSKFVTLTIYKYGCPDTYTSPDGYIRIQEADASFDISDTVWSCYPKEIIFNHNDADSNIMSGIWDFGYNNSVAEYGGEKRFNYPRPGEYYASLSVETTYGCRDTSGQQITITGPTGTFSIIPQSKRACRGDEIRLKIGQTDNVYDFEWDLGDGRFLKGDTVSYAYERMGTLLPKLILYGDSGICIPPPVVDTIYIYEVSAGIELPDSGYCDQVDLLFGNLSVGNTRNDWSFSNGITSTENEPVLQFTPGNYTVELRVQNNIGCSDTMTEAFIIHPLPNLILSPDTLVCAGDVALIRASGGDVIQWSPAEGLSDANSFSPVASPSSSIVYTAVSMFQLTGCRNSGSLSIMIQPEPEISLRPYPDTNIVIGEIISIYADSLNDVTYNWSPVDWLSCYACASPVARPLETTRYTLTVADIYHCFTRQYDLNIEVTEAYSLDVPTAFTPNGDGENDVVYVKGWGIKKLVEFRIYNRWGNEVFFSDDLARGWDGMYGGKIQNIDTYAYTVTVENWNGRIQTKKGTISLLR